MSEIGSSGTGENVGAGSTSEGPRSTRLPFAGMHTVRSEVRAVVVPVMLFASSTLMALAWLGHLRFEEQPFVLAMFACWLLVLPEYLLNITALRFGYALYSGAQMAAFRLCSGVVCVALVSALVLGESFRPQQVAGFVLMALAMTLIARSGSRDDGGEEEEDEFTGGPL